MPSLQAGPLGAILDPLLLVQGNGLIVDCNAAAERFTGANRQQIIGRNLADFSSDQGRQSTAYTTALHNVQQALATGCQRGEWEHMWGGVIFTLDVAFSRVDDSAEKLVLVHWHDISERKRIEDELRRSEERYRLLAENAHDVIWVMGLDGRFTYVSPSVEHLRGYTPEEVMQQTMDEVLSPESLRIVQESLVDIMEDVRAGRPIERDLTEIEQPCKDGSMVWTEVKTTGMYDSRGQFIGLLGVTRDIMDRRQRDEQLRQINATLEDRVRERTAELEAANAKLAKASQHKDEFLATVSHELRTPLTGILSFAQALEESVYGPLSERQLQAVHLLRQSGDHLLSMINGILDLSRLQADKLVLQHEAVDLDELCRLSLRALEGADRDAFHDITYVIDHPGIIIEADTQRVVQILGHLLRNAAKFTPPGGSIRLEVQSDLNAGCVTLSVIDTGIGIAAGDLPRLFQPFVQLDARLARRYQGAGIGLALVRAIAELHGGQAGVESTLGVGSRFWVTLPLRALACRPEQNGGPLHVTY